MLEDRVATKTSEEQRSLEAKVYQIYKHITSADFNSSHSSLKLHKDAHVQFLHSGLGSLPSGFISLDASRTWIVFWCLHSLALLNCPLPPTPTRSNIIQFLAECQHPDGGFGGGPFQLPHLAPTYAAVAALITLGGPDALSIVDRDSLQSFFLRMCLPPSQGGGGGGMTMHEGGEVDVRGCYCALATSRMLHINPRPIVEACGMAKFLKDCQCHEGGIGGEPGNEGHGGYAFCGLAAAMLGGEGEEGGMVEESELDVESMIRWAAGCQGLLEGGFMGRTNKLVDGCYSFWQGAAFPMLAELVSSLKEKKNDGNKSSHQYDTKALDRLAQHQIKVSKSDRYRKVLDADNTPSQAAEKEAAYLEAAIKKNRNSNNSAIMSEPDPWVAAKQHYEYCKACIPALLEELPEIGESSSHGPLMYNPTALQLWLLLCCQSKFGLRDKPGKSADFYHTCYCLSGLSISQSTSGVVLGGDDNKLAIVDPVLNVVLDKVHEADAYFNSLTI